jgi:hypothetical protein
VDQAQAEPFCSTAMEFVLVNEQLFLGKGGYDQVKAIPATFI